MSTANGTAVLGQAPPTDDSAERALLGALLIDPEALVQVAPMVKQRDFAKARHGLVYATILGLSERSEKVDFVSVEGELRRRGDLDLAGGEAYLIELINAAPSSLHAESYARQVARTADSRRMIRVAGEIQAAAYSGDHTSTEEALSHAEALLREAAEGREIGATVGLGKALSDYFAVFEAQRETTSTAGAVTTGFADLDRTLSGLRAGELVILAARPGAGKSALALNIARNVAVEKGVGTLVFSLEMSVHQLVERLLASEARVDSQRLRNGYIDEHEWRRVSEAFGVLSEAPIWLDESAAPSIAEIRLRARRAAMEHNIGLVVVDYLQLVRTPKAENRTLAVGEVSRGLKALARELGVPVLALSQLSRAVELRQDHRPQLSDLRESGSIEQDADVVMFIYRDELHNPNTDRRGVADLIVAKNRSGPIATLPLRWFSTFTAFADLELYRYDS